MPMKAEEVKVGADCFIVFGKDITKRKIMPPSASEWTKYFHVDTLPAQVEKVLEFHRTLANNEQLFKLKTN